MELWIRSQDKWALTTAKSVYVRFPDEKRASIFNQDNINIGQYSWKRALEILDEIEKYIGKQGKTELITEDGIHIQEIYYPNVYKMPKE